jgi:hypothetical protein
MYAVKDEDKRMGVSTRVWKRLGPDHAVLSLRYARVALDKFGKSQGGGRVVSSGPVRPDLRGSPTILPGGRAELVMPERRVVDDWRT